VSAGRPGSSHRIQAEPERWNQADTPMDSSCYTYLSKENRTDWGLLNALTLHAKNLSPNGNIQAHAQLGRYFGLGKTNPHVC
jgi:hypothetical protein